MYLFYPGPAKLICTYSFFAFNSILLIINFLSDKIYCWAMAYDFVG